jgi:pimeloyl-ACP methyl ester carboxylesterase
MIRRNGHTMADTSTATVLLVHGWAGSFDRTWKRSGLVDLLADAGRTVLPYDLPGHGSATKSHDPNEYRDLAGDVLARVGAQPVDAVGFSLGAITLLRALIRSPQSFNKVVLAGIGDGVFFPHDPARSERILSGLEGRAEPGDVTARIFGKIGNESHNDPLALAAVLRRPREDPMTTAQLAAVTNRMLLVLGDKDFSAPADKLVAALPNAKLLSLKGIDHFRTPESFEFIDAVLEFLGEP